MRVSDRLQHWTLKAGLVSALLMLWCGSVSAEFVGDFLKRKDKWPELIDLRHVIEGRLSTGAGKVLLLRKLPIAFQSKDDLPDLSGQRVVEAVGILRRDDKGELYFELLSVTRLDSDLERFQHQRLKLPARESEPLYQLSDWALARAEFYKDEELRSAAIELVRRALEREKANAPDFNRAAVEKLSRRAQKYGLAEEIQGPYLYEAHLKTWQKTHLQAKADELISLGEELFAELPGADVPVELTTATDREAWLQSPLATYETADAATRLRMHRYLYQQIMLEGIEKKALKDASNGQIIAGLLRKHLPEYSTLADQYRDRELAWRRSRITKATRAEMLALCEEQEAIGRKDESLAVFKEWFSHRERQLRLEGPDGLVELASEYETLVEGSQQQVVDLLLEAERKRPGSNFVAERLEAYGYRQMEGQWLGSEQATARENLPINRAMREGRVIRGMTSSQVRRTLGEPSIKTRMLTSQSIIELWTYGAGTASSRLTVRLQRRSRISESIVTSVGDSGTSP